LNALQLEQRRELFQQLDDQPWTYIGPSPVWDLMTDKFLGYRVGFYDSHFILRNLEENIFPKLKEEKQNGKVVEIVDLTASRTFIFPIEEWEARRDAMLKLLEKSKRQSTK